jgi:hypothetical protein
MSLALRGRRVLAKPDADVGGARTKYENAEIDKACQLITAETLITLLNEGGDDLIAFVREHANDAGHCLDARPRADRQGGWRAAGEGAAYLLITDDMRNLARAYLTSAFPFSVANRQWLEGIAGRSNGRARMFVHEARWKKFIASHTGKREAHHG